MHLADAQARLVIKVFTVGGRDRRGDDHIRSPRRFTI
jgi:hypothetical protein